MLDNVNEEELQNKNSCLSSWENNKDYVSHYF